ncbi:hypothetical protein BDP27DRAFT_1427802 [Rhodocollybia butyracea]|uniref:Uncharacterized protein n=1 Tax=Rhodocollybia butyracea TaxID=206335 RepID=A0A9P5U153_9AGAR|nr:hypothetical protein BDP27DRAFT_1427802 [Rhodocollybia butyracea]
MFLTPRIHCLALIFLSVLIFAVHGSPVHLPSKPISTSALPELWKAMRKALGKDAATTKVSVGGGLYMQHRNIRSTRDIDVMIEHKGLNRKILCQNIIAADKRFTRNEEVVCGVTFRADRKKGPVIPIDLIDESVTKYMPTGIILSELKDTDIPWAEPQEVIKMKILSAEDRLPEQKVKAIGDLKDAHDLIEQEKKQEEQKKGGVKTSYGVEMSYKGGEKAAITKALKEFFEKYPKESQWSEAEWKKEIGLDEEKEPGLNKGKNELDHHGGEKLGHHEGKEPGHDKKA